MYSRTAQMLLVLAIVVPIIGIGAVLLYVDSLSPEVDSTIVEAAPPAEAPLPDIALSQQPLDTAAKELDANPLQPIGPKASTRVIPPESGSCSSGGCTTTPTARSGCSSSSSCGD